MTKTEQARLKAKLKYPELTEAIEARRRWLRQMGSRDAEELLDLQYVENVIWNWKRGAYRNYRP